VSDLSFYKELSGMKKNVNSFRGHKKYNENSFKLFNTNP
jgi:hypothetical protein